MDFYMLYTCLLSFSLIARMYVNKVLDSVVTNPQCFEYTCSV